MGVLFHTFVVEAALNILKLVGQIYMYYFPVGQTYR